jgi:hypothetical protein
MSNSMQYRAGLHHVGVFQVSGAPYATGSVVANVATKIEFPRVTKWVKVANHGTASVKVGFSQNGMGSQDPHVPMPAFHPDNFYLRVPPHASGSSCVQTFDIKCTAIWLSGSHSVDVMAGLTGLEIITINNPQVSPSGSTLAECVNWTGSIGAQV